MEGVGADPRIQFSFLVTERHVKPILDRGLQWVSREKTLVYRPHGVVSECARLDRPVDLMLLAVKGDRLQSALSQWGPALRDGAWVLSMLNGVHNGTFLQSALTGRRVLDGCVYVGAHLEAPGRVVWEGGLRRLLFGDMAGERSDLEPLAVLFRRGGVDARAVHPVADAVWEKFAFVSPVAVVTALFECTLNGINSDTFRRALFLDLTREVLRLSRAEGRNLGNLTPESSAEKLTHFEAATTSSLYRDLAAGQTGEFDTLVEDVLRMARVHGLDLPAYELARKSLRKKYKLR
jgi:2-dehydropantoate 2-reductase